MYDPWNMHPHMYSYPSPHSFPLAVDNSTDVNPFCLCFIKDNISVCIGCKNSYENNYQPPNDLSVYATPSFFFRIISGRWLRHGSNNVK